MTDSRTVNITWSAPYGFSWSPAGEGAAERSSHALLADDGVWVIDPVDCGDLDERIAELGSPVIGVVVLLDRHMRDSVAVAERHGAQLLVVDGDSRQSIPDTAVRFAGELPGSPFEVLPVRDTGKLWHERALWWPEHRVLVVPESIGSAKMFTLGTGAPAAVHPMLRLVPPRDAFGSVEPLVVLFGHGPAITTACGEAIDTALDESRSRAPHLVAGLAKQAVSALRR